MRIGVLGAGRLGTSLGRRLGACGHEIMIGFSRSDQGSREAAASIGSGARSGTPSEVASHGEVVILATPWGETEELLSRIRHELTGKIIWDATNPLKASMDGLVLGTTTSAGEVVALTVPEARVVKAIPPFARVLNSADATVAGHKPSVFVCGDDKSATTCVALLLKEIGLEAVDAGTLIAARYAEPAGMLQVHLAYTQGYGDLIGASLLRERSA